MAERSLLLHDSWEIVFLITKIIQRLPQHIDGLVRAIARPVLLYNRNSTYVDRAVRDRDNYYETLLSFLNFPYPFTGTVQRLHGPFMLPQDGSSPYSVTLLPPPLNAILNP